MPDRQPVVRRLRRLSRQACRRVDTANWRSAAWALRALRRLRLDLAAVGTSAQVHPPPALPARAQRGVEAVLRRRRATCLERCLVLQRWLASQGRPHDVVIGVGAPGEAFAAHAWLADYHFDPESVRYNELTRLPSPARERDVAAS